LKSAESLLVHETTSTSASGLASKTARNIRSS
jgi:hypothetical protein